MASRPQQRREVRRGAAQGESFGALRSPVQLMSPQFECINNSELSSAEYLGARRSRPKFDVAAAAAPRLVSAEYPRRGRGVAATRLQHIRAAKYFTVRSADVSMEGSQASQPAPVLSQNGKGP